MKKVFELFFSDNDIREFTKFPFKQNGFIYATDCTAAIKIPQSNMPEYLNLINELSSPNISSLYNVPHTHKDVIMLEDLKKELKPVMIEGILREDVENECDDCGGDGVVEFEFSGKETTYYMDGDCQHCNGTGVENEVKITHTGKMVEDLTAIFSLYGVCYQYFQLKRLISISEILGVDKIIVANREESKANIFICGDAEIIIMPTLNYGGIEKNVIR